MRPPKTIKMRRLTQIMRGFGIELRRGRKHRVFCHPDGRKFPIPHDDGDDVERAYVNAARRAFGLTPADGISHREFYAV